MPNTPGVVHYRIMASRYHTYYMISCNHYRSQIIVHGAALPGLAASRLKYIQRGYSIDGTSAILMIRKSWRK